MTHKRYKTVLAFASAILCTAITAQALEINTKFGKPTMEEMEMTVYEPDKDASAVVLCHTGDARFRYNDNSGFTIDYEIVTRIKILKDDGIDYADVTIPYYDAGLSAGVNEEVRSIKAASYNLENGKIKKTELDKKMIFRENVYDDYWTVKFSIPAAKKGSVIEYRYAIYSERIAYPRTWYFQGGIPTLFSRYEFLIPEYFIFNIATKGYEHLDIKRESTSMSIPVTISRGRTEHLSCQATNIEAEGRNLPAIKDDKYIFNVGEYTSQLTFEMSGYAMPGQAYKNFANTWDDVDNMFFNSRSFNKGMDIDNPYREETAAAGFDKLASTSEKVEAIAEFVAKKIKWDGRYRLASDDVADEIKKGSGSNAVINFVIMSIMRENGIDCFPVVLKLRSSGMLPLVQPTFDDLDTFVIGFADEQGKLHYIDGSRTGSGVDILPVNMLVDKARIIDKDHKGDKWVSLSRLCANTSRTNIIVTVDGSVLHCRERQTLTGQFAAELREAYKAASDSAKFVTDLSASQNIILKKISFNGIDSAAPSVVVDSQYDVDVEATDSLVYICSTITPDLQENPFVEEKRELPVEFNYPTERVTMITMLVPENYVVEEVPAPIMAKTANGEAEFSFNQNLTANNLTMAYKRKLNATLFSFDMYPMLREIFMRMTDKNNEMIVLKKKP